MMQLPATAGGSLTAHMPNSSMYAPPAETFNFLGFTHIGGTTHRTGRLAEIPALWGLQFPEGAGFGCGLIPAVHFQDRRILPEIETPTRPRPAARFSHPAALNPIIAEAVQLFLPVRHNPLTPPPTSATLSRKGARAGSRRARALHCNTVIPCFLGKGF